MTFQELQTANGAIKTKNISGKEYAEVNQRIKAFRMVFPDGIIETQLISAENGLCVFRATVGFYKPDGSIQVLGTGTAYEKEGSSNVNKTSYIENCETSAVGRALGMAGFGIDVSVASAEEVQNAILQQNELNQKIGKNNVDALMQLIADTGTDADKVCEGYKVKSIADLTMEQWTQAMRVLTDRKEKQDAAG